MKNLKIFISLFLGFLLCSCTKNGNKELESYDWGIATYEEPFVGILDSRPSLLVNSLKYPPFAWLVSDTMTLSKQFKITFNEECIRSKSKVSLEFADSMGMPFEGVSFIVNGQKLSTNAIDIDCDKEIQNLNVAIKISPIQKERAFNGYIVATPIELDVINDINLSQEANIIATWKCEQEFEYPILIWCLWLLISVVIVFVAIKLVLFILILLIDVDTSAKVKKVSELLKFTMNDVDDNKNNTNDEKKKEKEEKHNDKCFRVPSLKGKLIWKSEDDPRLPYVKKVFKIHNHWVWGIFPNFEGDTVKLDEYYMSDEFWNLKGDKYEKQMRAASILLYEKIMSNPELQKKYNKKQLEQLKNGSSKIPGYTWHHKEDWLVMQLVKYNVHKMYKHTGGSYVWNKKNFIAKYGKEWLDNYIS